MRIARIPIEDPAWGKFTSAHPDASPFHLPAWAQLLADCYRFDAFVLAAVDTDGEILAGVPVVEVGNTFSGKRWVSLPFSDAVPVLARDHVDLQGLVGQLKDYSFANQVRELEIRSDLPLLPDVYPVQVGYRLMLDLPADPSELHPHKLHRNTRNRAKRNGIVVTRGSTPEDVANFYALHTLTRRRQGVPVQPRRFFGLISERLIEAGHGFVASARIDGELVAAGVYLAHNSTLVAKFGASDPERRDTGAGYLIDWEMMSAACEEGFRVYDLGRSDLDAEGLRRYKAGWGSSEAPLVYNHVSRDEPSKGRPSVGELRKRIIRNSPLWVCRGLGEILYRRTA